MNPYYSRGSAGSFVPGPDRKTRRLEDVQGRFVEIFDRLNSQQLSQEQIFSILSELVADVMAKVPVNPPPGAGNPGPLVEGGESILVDLAKVPSRFSVSAVLVLHYLREEPGQPAELGRKLQVSAAAMSGILDTLETKGLVTRVRDPRDRRKVGVELTEEGRRMAESMFPR